MCMGKREIEREKEYARVASPPPRPLSAAMWGQAHERVSMLVTS